MPHGTAHDAAQDITTTFIGRQYAIGDQKRRRAQMVCDHAEGCQLIASGLRAIEVFLGGDQIAEQVNVVIVVQALKHGRDPLQPHACIDRWLGQILACAVGLLVELHEDEVPDFDEPVTILVRATGRATRNAFAMIVEYFRARAARASIAHRPEIIGCADPDDLAVIKSGNLFPDRGGFVIFSIDCDEQLLRIERELLGAQLPSERDRVFLEIIAKGKITQHLEECVVTRSISDIVEIIVLAARAHAFLGRGCPRPRRRFGPGEYVLERDHAGIHEQKRRVVLWDERRGRLTQMTSLLEEGEKGLANLVYAGHGQHCVLAMRVGPNESAQILHRRYKGPFAARQAGCATKGQFIDLKCERSCPEMPDFRAYQITLRRRPADRHPAQTPCRH